MFMVGLAGRSTASLIGTGPLGLPHVHLCSYISPQLNVCHTSRCRELLTCNIQHISPFMPQGWAARAQNGCNGWIMSWERKAIF